MTKVFSILVYVIILNNPTLENRQTDSVTKLHLYSAISKNVGELELQAYTTRL